ncbi:MAG TPA: glycerol-3-phosphate dehydrogenase subunit GlpB [Streptosporangiaceae bacterium]|nr:glycerol-3-phosphate dehydrogenase subunit GlpB [Streptosporangiaceae bacterium]
MSEQPGPAAADVIVLGAGMAGLVAAVRLAEAGLRVVTVAKGYGSLRLAPATIDILGYAPGRVDSPAQALPGFAAAHPEHPYALISPAVLADSVQWLKEHVGTYAYAGDSSVNMLLPTALGVPRPSAVVPETMAGGDVREAGPVVIAGLSVLKDFHPALAAENLQAATAAYGRTIEARPVLLNVPADGQADVGALALARRFEDAAFRGGVAAELRQAVRDEEAVGLPAVLGMDQARSVWTELQQAAGRPVFEIPTAVPPSVPGMRLARALQDRLRRAGGRVMLGAEATGPELRDGKLAGVRIRSAARVTPRACRWVVLATGGLASGGIEVDVSGTVSERALALPVQAPGPDQAGFGPGYLGDHPMETAGLRVDGSLRPVGPDGEPVYENVYAAGAVIGGARPWREKSGDGISLSTGYLAAEAILKEAG